MYRRRCPCCISRLISRRWKLNASLLMMFECHWQCIVLYTVCMVKPHCPACHQNLAPSDINMREGVALCSSCGALTRVGDLGGLDDASEQLGDLPEKFKEWFGLSTDTGDWTNTVNDLWRAVPSGCSVKGSRDDIRIAATTRAYGSAAAMLFFAVFWNSIVSIFLAAALSGVWSYFFGKLPAWFPSQGSNQKSMMPIGMALFVLVFMIPFVSIGVMLIVGILMSLFGSVKMRIRHEQASVSSGIGPICWSRRFEVNNVTNVCLGEKPVKTKNNSSKNSSRSVHIQAHKLIRVGSSLSENRMKWFGSVATLLLMEPRQQDVDDLLRAGRQSSR